MHNFHVHLLLSICVCMRVDDVSKMIHVCTELNNIANPMKLSKLASHLLIIIYHPNPRFY